MVHKNPSHPLLLQKDSKIAPKPLNFGLQLIKSLVKQPSKPMSQTISATKTSPLIKTLILKIKCLWQVGEILGGQLAQFTDCWTAMGAPLSILKTIKGYAFLFNQKPPLCSLHPPIPPPLITPKSTNMSKTVSSLLTNCIILPATTSMGFLAPMFSRLKPNRLGTTNSQPTQSEQFL